MTPHVFYQAYLPAFDPAGLRGLVVRATYLRYLGVDAVITQAVSEYRHGTLDRYYSPVRHDRVDPEHGGEYVLRRVNRALSARGVVPFGDLVVNHVDRTSPIVTRATRRPREFGHWLRTSTDPGRDGWHRSTNIFGRPAWQWVKGLQRFVSTPFSEDQFALAHEADDVVRYLLQVAGTVMLDDWGYRGLRLDAVASVVAQDLTDHPIGGLGPETPSPLALSFISALRRKVLDVRQQPDGTAPCAIAEAGGSNAYMRTLMADPSVQLAYDVSWSAVMLRVLAHGSWQTLRDHLESEPQSSGRLIRYLGSHDERQLRYVPYRDELVDRYGGKHGEFTCFGGNGLTRRFRAMMSGPDAHVMSLAVTTLAPGCPLFFQGDLEGLLGDSRLHVFDARDPNRCRMPWDSRLPAAGWGSESPHHPLDPQWRTHSVADQLQRPGSILRRARQFVHLRRQSVAIRAGTASYPLSSCPAVLAIVWQEPLHDDVVVLVNASASPRSSRVDLSRWRYRNLVPMVTEPPPTGRRRPVVAWERRYTWADRRLFETRLGPYEVAVYRVLRPEMSSVEADTVV